MPSPEHQNNKDQERKPEAPAVFRAGRFEFPLRQRTYIMGILNVTPDSFSDGGCFFSIDTALHHAEEMLRSGADILDIGGESTRPGYLPVSEEEELHRVIPVIEKLVKSFGCPISIDTYKSEVAKAAVEAGACIINDVNGLQEDSGIASVAAALGAGIVVMHNARLYRDSTVPDSEPFDIMADMGVFLRKSCRIAAQAGIPADRLVIDPGIGFGVTPEESIEMLERLDELVSLGFPILIGPSRKRFIGHILGPDTSRLSGTIAAAVLGIAKGADFVRVHDVREVAEASRVADAICRRANARRR